MPMPHETLVFFDDGRYTMGDETSAAAFCSHLEDRLSRLDRKTLLVLADRRVATGEIMKIAALARRSGVESVLSPRRGRERWTNERMASASAAFFEP